MKANENKHKIIELTDKIRHLFEENNLGDGFIQADIDLLKSYTLSIYDIILNLNKKREEKEKQKEQKEKKVKTKKDVSVEKKNENEESEKAHEQVKDLFSNDQAEVDNTLSLHEKYIEETPDLVDQLSKENIQDLKMAIGVNERVAFINELFEGNAAAFDDAMQVLNESNNLDDANKYINTKLKPQYSWKEGAGIVKEFSALIEKRFLSESTE